MAGRGGKTPGAGAPKGNQHTAKHGIWSKTIQDPETRKAFDEHFAALQKDPKQALLASAALIKAHVSRVIRCTDENGFFHAETVDSNGEKSFTTIKRVEVTDPIARALKVAANIVVNAHEVEKARKEIDSDPDDGPEVHIHLHPDLVEED